ncbi:TPA_asm: hypothetical protein PROPHIMCPROF_56 [Mycobacterium phage McProf]|nr:TPA_asm: hypothetical protein PROPHIMCPROF_56 [Mycobacterium phage McProf]
MRYNACVDAEMGEQFAKWYAKRVKRRVEWAETVAQFYLCWEQGIHP